MKTTEEINLEWEQFRDAKKKCKGLRRFVRLWNARAGLRAQLDRIESNMKDALKDIPDEYVKHLPKGRSI